CSSGSPARRRTTPRRSTRRSPAAPSRSMAADRPLRRAVLLALALSLLLPAAVLAHGGPRVHAGTEGPYHVAVDERLIGLEGGLAALDSTIYLEDAATGEPVTDA